METHRVTPEVSVLSDRVPVPGLGFLPVNAFVLHAAEPVVIDTGLSLPDRDFLTSLSTVVDPADVRWIVLTHPDRDHTGGLFALLDAAPQARVVTTFVSAGIMSTAQPLPLDRVHLVNPGQQLDVGDRTLSIFRPPLYDSPATIGCYDRRSGACFSADCFGAPMPTDQLAVTGDVRDLPGDDLRAAQLLWSTVDSPWVAITDQSAYLATLQPLRDAQPELILSSHLPPAVGLTAEFLEMLAAAPAAPPFASPDQQALEALLATFEPPPEP